MRKLLFLVTFSFIVAVTFLSCSKDKSDNDDPGNIPGMGDAGGDLEVDGPSSYPIQPSIIGDITGLEVAPLPTENVAGSGGGWVILDIEIENTTDEEADFYLLGGSVIECQEVGYQNAISINRVDVSVEAESSKHIKLLVYCINRGRSGSSPEISYIIKGVSSSDRMMRLVEALENKKIDIRGYLPDDKMEFIDLSEKIQDLVWEITNGSGLSDDDWTFINSLPTIDS
ncbi:MAG: hypothetical protein ACI93S_000772 [Ancylomarina sp.]|jgi:hypothetical protein